MKLSRKLILIFMVAMMAIVGFIFIYVVPLIDGVIMNSLEKNYSKHLNHVDDYLLEMTESISEDIDIIVENSQVYLEDRFEFNNYTDVENSGIDIEMTSSEKALINLFKNVKKSKEQIEYVYLGTEESNFVMDVPLLDENASEENIINYDPKERPWYKIAMQSPEQIIISDIYRAVIPDSDEVIASETQDYYIAMAKTVDYKGEIIGVLAVDLNLSQVSKQLREEAEENASIGIIQNQSALRTNENGEINLDIKTDNVEFYNAVEKIVYGRLEIIDVSSGQYLVIKQRSTVSDWDVFYSIDKKYIDAYREQIAFPFIVTFLMAMVLIVTLVILVINFYVLRPINKLSVAVADVSLTGKLEVDIGVGNDEVSILSKSFNKMFNELSDYKENLEDLIEERTKELTQFKKAIEHNSAVVVITDISGEILYVNPKFTEVTGYSKEEAIGQNPRVLSSGLTPQEVYADLWKTIKEGNEWSGTFINKTKSGELFYENAILSPIEDENGNITRVVAVKEDITDKEKLKEELIESYQKIKDSEHRLHLASRSTNLGMWDFYPSNNVTTVNKTWATQKLYDPLDMLTTDEEWAQLKGGFEFWKSSIHPDDLDLTLKLLNAYINGEGDIYRAEYRFKCKNGDYKWILDIGKAIEFDEGNQIKRIMGINMDIDEMKAVELELSESLESIKKTKVELELAKLEAEAATKAKSDFLANMSHEIRTPMNAVIGLNSLLEKTELKAKQKDYVNKIGRSANNLLNIINDILDFSKIESGKLDVENLDFSLQEVMDNLSSMLVMRAYEKSLELIIVIDKDVPMSLVGDPFRIGQILLNLTNNAVKFTEHGEIIIGVKLDKVVDDKVCLSFSIEDSGIGMTDEQISGLFQSFSQADTSTTRKYGGTGLGLSISKNLVELMGGEISVESEFGKGSKFTFTSMFGVSSIEYKKRSIIPEKLRDLKILVVEDNEYARDVLEAYLESFTFKPTIVKSGEDAIDEISAIASYYDLILMDWKMGGLNGIDTWRQIKRIIPKEYLPKIILVTAYGKEGLYQEAKNEGFDDVLNKPVSQSTLFDAIIRPFSSEYEIININEAFENVLEGFDDIRGAKILLAEDNEINQQVAREILEMEGFWVDIADNGQIAVDKLKDNEYDLVLMDLQMPVLDGYKASRTIRSILKNSDIKIVALSADAMSGTKEKVFDAGMNDYISKPIDKTELFASLVKWIEPGDRDRNYVDIDDEFVLSEDTLHKFLDNVDVNDGLSRIAGNVKLYYNVILKFKKNNEDFEDQISKLLSQGKREESIRMVHTLKGVSGNIGAKFLNYLSKTLEDLIKDDESSENQINDEIKELGKEIQILINQIELIIDHVNLNDTSVNEVKEISAEELLEKFEELKLTIEEYEPSAVELHEFLRSYISDKDYYYEFEKMGELLREYDFDEAKEICNSIINSI